MMRELWSAGYQRRICHPLPAEPARPLSRPLSASYRWRSSHADVFSRVVHYDEGGIDRAGGAPVTGEPGNLTAGMTVAELCGAAVSHSDNTAANLLLEQLGGPAAAHRPAARRHHRRGTGPRRAPRRLDGGRQDRNGRVRHRRRCGGRVAPARPWSSPSSPPAPTPPRPTPRWSARPPRSWRTPSSTVAHKAAHSLGTASHLAHSRFSAMRPELFCLDHNLSYSDAQFSTERHNSFTGNPSLPAPRTRPDR